MPGRENKRIGKIGEEEARRFLRRKGYEILAKNFRTRLGEIDAVARYRGFIVFIEIKTRASSSLGPPYLSVTRAKQARIIRNALIYLKRYGLDNVNWRIDVVSVKLDHIYGLEDIEIIENAVEDNCQGG